MAAALCALLPTSALADTIIDNVRGVTIGEDGKIERFAAIQFDDDGKIVSTFEMGEMLPNVSAHRIDAQGKAMLPGFVDAHVHVMGIGFGALTLDLSDTQSLDEALEKIRVFAAENPNRPWILGRGWNQEKWGLGRFPTAAELDSAVGDRPVYLQRVDGHAGWANTLAMQQADITAEMADPEGGKIERLASNAPSGIFVDAAEGLVTKAVPEPRPAERDVALAKAQERLHAHGITAVADMGTSIEDWQTFRRAGDAGWLAVRIMAYAAGVEAMDLIAGPRPTPWLYDDTLRLNGVKLYLDGALGSRGAWLKRPYSDDPANTGLPLMDPTRLRNLMSRAAIGNFQLAIHAIGDAANAEVLDAVEELAASYGNDRRWRIEHAQIVDPTDIPRFGRHGIIASMQPTHQTSDRIMAEARLDEGRLDGAYAWRSIAEAGGTLAFGSDAPVEMPDPLAGLAAALSRTDADDEPAGGWRPDETVSRQQALAAFTSDAAFAGYAEGRFGKLIAGEHADFVLLDRDPLTISPAQIRNIEILETWVGGRQVYARDKSTSGSVANTAER